MNEPTIAAILFVAAMVGIIGFSIRIRTKAPIRIDFTNRTYFSGEVLEGTLTCMPSSNVHVDKLLVELICYANNNSEERGDRTLYQDRMEIPVVNQGMGSPISGAFKFTIPSKEDILGRGDAAPAELNVLGLRLDLQQLVVMALKRATWKLHVCAEMPGLDSNLYKKLVIKLK